MAEDNDKTIFDLDLHESLTVQTNDNFLVINRVPGGWIYNSYIGGNSVSAVFVPRHGEFRKNKTAKINV